MDVAADKDRGANDAHEEANHDEGMSRRATREPVT